MRDHHRAKIHIVHKSVHDFVIYLIQNQGFGRKKNENFGAKKIDIGVFNDGDFRFLVLDMRFWLNKKN